MKFDPVLLDIPESLETERLHLRSPKVGDGAIVNEAIVESLNELAPWMPWVHPVPSPELSEKHARRARAEFLLHHKFRFHVFLKETGQFAGCIGIEDPDWEVPRFEIGYWVRTSLCGQGIATEATRTLLQLCFEKLGANRVQLRTSPANSASQSVAKRAGFLFEACLHDNVRNTARELEDTLVFALTREQWKRLSEATR